LTSIVDLENVSYKYPHSAKFALDGISLAIKEGEFFALMGENGSGKTTFCRLINGIIPHHYTGKLSGNVTVDGLSTVTSAVPQLALKVGMVLDDPDTQLFTSTVFDEVAFGPENILLPPDEIKKRVSFALSVVGLEGFEDRIPSTLSGGEKQRLSIAAAIAMEGKILVLDEPLCRLDPEGSAQVISVLKDIRKKHKITVIMASHESAVIADIADRVCILNNGKIICLDTPKNIFANYSLLEQNGINPHVNTQNYVLPKGITKRSTNVSGSPAIDIKDLCFKYANGAGIENISLSIADNDFAAIIGKNGCGKTTLLKNITGLLHPCSGDIYIRGRNTKELTVSDISAEIGYVMQNPDSQLFSDSVYKEVSFALKNMRLCRTEIKKRTEDAVKITEIDDIHAFPHALARPERTRVVIACVLAMGCKIIIFDEVDVGNDYRGNLKIMNIARELHERGFTIIFITHNMSLACEYAHRLINMDKKGLLFDERLK
jgi:energy-coupling factor transport system ATP-binding protein